MAVVTLDAIDITNPFDFAMRTGTGRIDFTIDTFHFRMYFSLMSRRLQDSELNALGTQIGCPIPNNTIEIAFDRIENIMSFKLFNPNGQPPLTFAAAKALQEALELCLKAIYKRVGNNGFYFTSATAALNIKYNRWSPVIATRIGFSRACTDYRPGEENSSYVIIK